MNFKNFQEMTKDIIERESIVEFDKDFKYMTKKEFEDHKKAEEFSEKLFNVLKAKLDEEGQAELRQLIDLQDFILFQEVCYYFERGVRCGLTTLSYLNKYCDVF